MLRFNDDKKKKNSVPGMSCDQIQVIVRVQECHVVVLNTSVDNIHQIGRRNSLDLHFKTLRSRTTRTTPLG